MNNGRLLLVGDNPFHGISHLSQERAISRGRNLTDPEFAARLVRTALDSGADGFMFSVSDTTLSILKKACEGRKRGSVQLYALAPYVFGFVRLAVTEGGIPGLTKRVGREILLSANLRAILHGAAGLAGTDPAKLLKAYLLYEESRIRSAAGASGALASVFLHEVLTDMALALGMEWVLRTHIDLMDSRGISPGLHTHNLPLLVRRLNEWGIDSRGLTVTTQFNCLGFGMSPSKEECEEALRMIPDTRVIANGVLASGYLGLPEAIEYVKSLPQLRGVAVGVSNDRHARETFKIMRLEL